MVSFTGLDAVKLIPMIVQAANKACMHKENCRQLAEHLQLIGDLLREITISKIKRCQAARKPLELLEEALRKSYRLVTRCQNRNFFYVLLMGWNIENQFRELEKKIDRFLNVIPLINLMDNARVKELLDQIRHDKEKAAAKQRAKKAAAEERRRAERKRAERAAAERAKKAAAEEKERAKRAAAEKRERDKRAAAERAKKAAAEEKERAKRAAKGRPEKTTAKKK